MKIQRSVPYNQGSLFFISAGKYKGEKAIDLFAFYEELTIIENESVVFHFPCHNFQKWIEETFGDIKLAYSIDKINPHQPGEKMKKEILETMEVRLNELRTLLNDPNLR